jgi:hypothetical protein
MRSAWGRTVIVTAAVAVFATATAYAAHASSTRARVGSQVVDKTYSCRAARKHPVLVAAAVRYATAGSRPRPAVAAVTTVRKVVTRYGVKQTATQVGFEDVKNSLRVDTSVCRLSSRRVVLKPSGLSLDETVTPRFAANLSVGCPAHADRVLIRVRIALTDGRPQRALLSVRRDDAKRRPVAFLNWDPRKITDYLADDCGAG